MWFSIGLLIASCSLYGFHFLAMAFPFDRTDEIISLLMGCALVGIILSTACFFMNRGMLDLKGKKRVINWMLISVIAFVIFISYIVFCLFDRASNVGITF